MNHRTVKHYHAAGETTDIRYNDAVNELAKMASEVFLPGAAEGEVDNITISNGITATRAKKWIMECHHESAWGGTHLTSWLPLKAVGRMTCMTWLWGYI